ncbi:MAG TPA: protease pro-enzyme activation domain-containing protein, partial [Candidatus Limnocylindria bacterium]|nr:protease pro-enzyme activation domain-containing protein [Candidatus Limnocylindria bacterium]
MNRFSKADDKPDGDLYGSGKPPRRRPFARLLLIWALTVIPVQLPAADAHRITLAGSIHVERESVAAAATSNPRPHAIVARRALLPEEAAADLEFGVALRMRDLGGLQARVAAGELIAPEEMAEKYWPLATDEARVADWLQAEGFTITRRDDNHLAVFASGPVSRVQEAFQTAFARVTVGGVDYTSAVTAPSLPAAPAHAVLGVNGLQPHIRPRHQGRIRPLGTTAPLLPAQILKAYHANGLTWTGAGQTIAIVIDTPPRQTDLTAFWKVANVAQSLANVQTVQVISGALPAPDGEESLDVEWSSAMAPGAKIRVYATRDLTDAHLDRAYQQVYQDTKTITGLRQMSLSYGLGETETSTDQLQTDAQYFANLASAGVTVFASSGDDGSNPDETLQVESPASDVNVTAVGGTSLYLDATGAVSSEVAWNGSGGGMSGFFSRPGWQTGAGMPAGTQRLVPDVALPGDPDTGALVYLNGARHAVGGTSWSSPTWAGFCALLNQARTSAGRAPVGVLGAKVYPLLGTASFRDITGGNNGSYSAGPGYDLCTGVGVPNVATLIQVLAGGPEITTQPSDQSITPGQDATFVLTVKSSTALSYQWQREAAGTTVWTNLADGGNYSGAKTATFIVRNANAGMNGDQFRCLVSNSAASLLSLPVTLTVRTAELAQVSNDPGVQPISLGVPLQATFVFANTGNQPSIATKVYLYFSASATDFSPAAKVGEIPLPVLAAGTGTGVLPFSYLPPAGTPTGTYYLNYWIDAPGLVPESDENNNRGSRTFLIRATGPSFTLLPTSQTVAAGGTAKFTVAAQGTAPLNYRWSRKPAGSQIWKSLSDDGSYSGSADPTLTVSHATPAMNGDQFECLVTNSVAGIISSAAPLVVEAPDLTAASTRVVPPLGNPGATFTRILVVTNLGTASAPPTQVDFFVNSMA